MNVTFIIMVDIYHPAILPSPIYKAKKTRKEQPQSVCGDDDNSFTPRLPVILLTSNPSLRRKKYIPPNPHPPRDHPANQPADQPTQHPTNRPRVTAARLADHHRSPITGHRRHLRSFLIRRPALLYTCTNVYASTPTFFYRPTIYARIKYINPLPSPLPPSPFPNRLTLAISFP